MRTFIVALKVFLVFTILTGIIYPLVITGLSQVFFSEKANGSLILDKNNIVGSKLIGQQFDSEKYFSSRPSAINHNPMPSGGTNYGLTSGKLRDLFESRSEKFRTLNLLDSLTIIPSEMLFSSASGLDPHISPEAAFLQYQRIVKARKLDERQAEELKQLIIDHIEEPQHLLLGIRRVNVLMLNLEVDLIK